MSKSNETTPNVPTLRFKSFEQEWEYSTIGKCSISLEYGMNAAAVKYDGKHKYIRITDIDEETSAFIPNPLSSPDGEFEQKYLVKENDILFARTGASVGKSYLYNPNDGELYFAGFLIRARIKPEYNGTFIYYQTKSKKYDRWVKLTSMRSGQPGINSQEYSGYPIAITGKVEQDKIADFLQLIDNRIAVQNKIISKYETLIKGIIDCLLNKKEDNYYTFKDLYLKAGEGGTPTTDNDSYYENGTIPFIKIDDLSQKYIKRNSDYITYLGLEKSAAWLIPSNSVIFSNGATIGRISINTYPIATKQGVLGIVPSPIVMTEYLYYYMKTTYFRGQVRRITVKGTMDCAYLKDLNSIICHIPEINHQEKRIALLTVLDEKIACERMLLQKLKEQKKYLLSKMFI